jgi:hypothetical protein
MHTRFVLLNISGLEIREYGRGIRCADHATPSNLQKLALTSPKTIEFLVLVRYENTSREGKSPLASQETVSLLRKDHCRTNETLKTYSSLSHKNSVYTLISYSFKIHINIILLFMSRPCSGSGTGSTQPREYK